MPNRHPIWRTMIGRTILMAATSVAVASPASAITVATIQGDINLDADGGSPSLGLRLRGCVLAVDVLAQAGGIIPNATKFTISPVDGGWDTSGNATTVTRALVPLKNVSTQANDLTSPTAMLRRPAPNEATVYCEQPVGTRTSPGSLVAGQLVRWFVVLPDFVYQGTTSVSGAVASGWYGTAAAGTLPTITNSSTRPYPQPKFGWFNDPLEPITSNSMPVEFWCNSHRHARNGQAVACVEFWGFDGTNSGTLVRSSVTALSSIQTLDAISEVFKATVDLTGLNDTDGSAVFGAGIQTVDGYIKPWIGPRYRLSVDGISSWPTPQPCVPLPFVKDVAGKYGGAIAYVNPGVAGATPTVSRTAAANYAAAAVVAYSTYALAVAAIATFNNQTGGRPAGAIVRSDRAGEVRVLVNTLGVDQAFELSANETQTPGIHWTTIRNAPENTSGKAFYNAASGRIVKTLLRSDGMDWTRAGSTGGWNGNDTGANSPIMLSVRNGTLTWNAGTTGLWVQNCGYLMLRNWKLAFGSTQPSGSTAFALGSQGTSSLKCFRKVGVTIGDSTSTVSQQVISYFDVGVSGKFVIGDPSGNQLTNDGGVLDNFRAYAITANGNWLDSFTITRGIHIGQGVVEYTAANDWGPAGNTSASFDIDDLILEYVTEPYDKTATDAATIIAAAVGRMNHCYDNTSSTRNHRRYGSNHFNYSALEASKSDVFGYYNSGSITGCTGNHEVAYNVSHEGNCFSVVRPATFTPIDYWRKVVDPYSTDNLGAIAFVTNNAGAGQTGWGDYRLPVGAHPLKSKVPAGHSRRGFDLAGLPRLNDGTGAAGAYEGR